MRLFRTCVTRLGMLLVFGVGCFHSTAVADQITFTHTGVGSGSIGAIDFTDAAFTITAIGDTANREQPASDVYSINHDSAVIDITGVGVFTFITGTRTFVNQSSPIVGFSRAGSNGLDLYNGPIDASFATWDMLSSIGPIFGDINLLQWSDEDVDTTGGVLLFNTATTRGYFQASVGNASVPEPASIVCFGIGMIGFVAVTRAARHRTHRA